MTAQELLAAAEQQGLVLEPDVELDATGADFLVGTATDAQGTRWILRAPRRQDVFARAGNEHHVLRTISSYLPVSVPDWRVFTPELIAYPRLAGEPSAIIDLAAGGYVWRFDPTAPPDEFISTLAAVLARLHSIPEAVARNAGLTVEQPQIIREAWSRRLERARTSIEVPEAVWTRWQRWVNDERYWPVETAMIHGDLHPPHILLDDTHRVVGILDWTEARFADPASDFTLLFATLGRDGVGALLDQYRAAGGRTSPHMLGHIEETWRGYPAVLVEFAEASQEEGPRQLAQSLVSGAA